MVMEECQLQIQHGSQPLLDCSKVPNTDHVEDQMHQVGVRERTRYDPPPFVVLDDSSVIDPDFLQIHFAVPDVHMQL